MPSEPDVKMADPLEVFAKEEQHAFFVVLRNEWDRTSDDLLSSMGRTVCHNEVHKCGSTCLKAAEPVLLMQTCRYSQPHPQTTNMKYVQAMILQNRRVTTAEAAPTECSVARPWCKPLVD
jgi:hypothetical protein